MKWIENVINNQFLFYSFLAILGVGAIILFTLIYMDRKNLKLFQAEEKNLLDELEDFTDTKEDKEEVKITQITEENVEDKPKANLEEVLEKMQADLDKKEDVVAIFEQEQEEKAIISYQELLKSKNKNTVGANKELVSVIEQIESAKPEVKVTEPVYEIEKEEEFSDPYYDGEVGQIEEDDFLLENKDEPKKFKTTDFISPIYGKVENHIEYPKIPNFNEVRQKGKNKNSIELDKKADLLEETESNHNDAFLNALKEFRSHLE